jgi:hypothetical protein
MQNVVFSLKANYTIQVSEALTRQVMFIAILAIVVCLNVIK